MNAGVAWPNLSSFWHNMNRIFVCQFLKTIGSTVPTSARIHPVAPPHLFLFGKRLLGEAVDGDPGMEAARRRSTSRAKRKGKQVPKHAQEPLRTQKDIMLSWEARRGSSTALVGLGRGGEALMEAQKAIELADQVGERVGCLKCANIRQLWSDLHGARAYIFGVQRSTLFASCIGRFLRLLALCCIIFIRSTRSSHQHSRPTRQVA